MRATFAARAISPDGKLRAGAFQRRMEPLEPTARWRSFQVGHQLPERFDLRLCWSRDGKQLVVARGIETSDAVLVSNLTPAAR